MANFINKDYYRPIIKDFYNKTASAFEDSQYPHEPFIPYTMPNYENAPIKIFYVGIDTLNWEHSEDFLELMKSGKVDEWLQQHADRCSISDMYEENSTTFFSLVARIQLMVRTGKYYTSLANLNDKELAIINEIGYGNTHSIELPQTVNKEGWNDIDMNKCDDIYHYGYILLDGIHHIINAYHPDYIIATNSTFDTNSEYRGLHKMDISEIFSSKDPLLKVWQDNNSKTKIINVNHPNNRLGVSMEDITKMVLPWLEI